MQKTPKCRQSAAPKRSSHCFVSKQMPFFYFNIFSYKSVQFHPHFTAQKIDIIVMGIPDVQCLSLLQPLINLSRRKQQQHSEKKLSDPICLIMIGTGAQVSRNVGNVIVDCFTSLRTSSFWFAVVFYSSLPPDARTLPAKRSHPQNHICANRCRAVQ